MNFKLLPSALPTALLPVIRSALLATLLAAATPAIANEAGTESETRGKTGGPLASDTAAGEEESDKDDDSSADEQDQDASQDIEQILFGGPASISGRIREEDASVNNRFALIAHRPSYLMPLTWNFQADDASFTEYGAPIDPLEMKFQLSVKVPIWRDLVGEGSQLSFGYTQKAWWQAYNNEVSRPFRETNHEPELMLDLLTDFEWLGFTNRVIRFGLDHQSNGRIEPLSRSWNRLYAEFLVERGGFAMSLRPWVRIPESAADDDNPDIEDYMGHVELRFGWRNGDNNYTLMLRNNLESQGNRGAVEVTWSYAINSQLRGYVQVFSGYGESLVDYNRSVTRLGIGVQLTDWL